jgi:serine/threonine-protein kinase RsbT
MPEARHVVIENDLDIVAARVEGRNLAREMGFGVIDQARIATVISELARNVILYAHGGQIILTQVARGGRVGLEVNCEDQGPGIKDLESIMAHGQSTAREVGMGLPGAKRLMDEFEVRSQVGVGTRVVARKWLP